MAKDGPRVSVVIAAHQAAATLGRALDSALGQRGASLEVLVVDDASSDGGRELVRRWAAADPRLRLIALDVNGGPGRARNRALDAARGEWIALLDADDAFQPSRLARLLAVAGEAGADLIADNLRYVEAGSGRGLGTAVPRGDDRAWSWVSAAAFVDRNIFSTRTFKFGYLKPLMRRAFLERHRIRYREDIRVGEDFHLYLDCLLAGARFAFVPEALYDYSQTPGSQSRRLTIADVERLRAANLDAEARAVADDLKQALRARDRDLERQLLHMHLVAHLKARRPERALALLARRPDVLPLALASGRESVVKRLARWRRPGQPPVDLAPSDRQACSR